MASRPVRPSSHAVLGASIALTALLCAWPSRASAGCSHYAVARTDSGPVAHQQLTLLEDLGAVDASSEVPVRPKPCSGAFCSGKPAVPVPVSLTTVRTTDAVAAWLLAPPDPRAKGRPLAHAERNVRAVIEGTSILRPPR